MSDPSRRGFLILTGAGPMTDGSLVAYVSDVHKGEVSVMMGERKVVVQDRALCASLGRALS